MTPLLEQFLSEARDLLESASEGLLALERHPEDTETINAVFRAVHTLKGGSGLFPFAPLTALLHGAEDALDGVRRGTLTMNAELFDALLACVDAAMRWLEEVAEREALPANAEAEGRVLVDRVRSHLGGSAGAATKETAIATQKVALHAIDVRLRSVVEDAFEAGTQPLLVQYAPDPECFFQGDDPLLTVLALPELLGAVSHGPPEGWPGLSDLDPFRCRLTFEAISTAPESSLRDVLKYVAEQVTITAIDAPADLAPEDAFLTLLRDQREALSLLSREEQALRLANVATVAANAMRFMGSSPARIEALSKASVVGDVYEVLRVLDAAIVDAEPQIAPDAVAAPAQAAAQADAARTRGLTTVKVDQNKIDLVMNLVGELVVAKNGLPYLARRTGDAATARELREQYSVLHRIADALQTAVMQMRMMPMGVALQRFPRLVRDLAKQLGKQVEIVLEGEETEADKTVIEKLGEPLTHLVRNSLDHGLELPEERERAGKPPTGRLVLSARHDGDRIVLDVSDDGRGIDPVRIKKKAIERGLVDEAAVARMTDDQIVDLVFAPGFSTAETVSNVSGRGVGMDAVRRDVEALGGRVEIVNRPGKGTTMRLSLPVSMAVSRVLIVRVGDERYGVPMDAVVGVVRVPVRELTTIKNERVFLWRGRIVPVLDLASMLGTEHHPVSSGEISLVITQAGGEVVALSVDAFDADVDVVLKPMEGLLASCRGLAGTAILGDGRALLVLDPKELLSWESKSQMAA